MIYNHILLRDDVISLSEKTQQHTFIPKYGAAARSNEKNIGSPKADATGNNYQ